MPKIIAEFMLGDIIDAKYRVVKPIGKGGMGTVYQVRDERLQEMSALKMQNPNALGDESLALRFIKEARIGTILNDRRSVHEGRYNVMTVLHYDTWNGRPYYVMPLIVGRSLLEYLRKKGKVPAPAEAFKLIREIYAAVAFTHAHGIIHRDIKPQNVMLELSGPYASAILCDFGVAKFKKSRDHDAHETRVGTVFYAPREQNLGAPCTEKVDIYSTAMIAYWMLSGRTCWAHLEQPMVEILLKEQPPTAAPLSTYVDLGREIDETLARCLSHAPDERPDATYLVDFWGEQQKLAQAGRKFAVNTNATLETVGAAITSMVEGDEAGGDAANAEHEPAIVLAASSPEPQHHDHGGDAAKHSDKTGEALGRASTEPDLAAMPTAAANTRPMTAEQKNAAHSVRGLATTMGVPADQARAIETAPAVAWPVLAVENRAEISRELRKKRVHRRHEIFIGVLLAMCGALVIVIAAMLFERRSPREPASQISAPAPSSAQAATMPSIQVPPSSAAIQPSTAPSAVSLSSANAAPRGDVAAERTAATAPPESAKASRPPTHPAPRSSGPRVRSSVSELDLSPL